MLIRLALGLILVYVGVKAAAWVRRHVSVARVPVRGVEHRCDDVHEMVKDPVCGVYVVVGEAVSGNADGRIVYFCSEACRRKFLDMAG